MKCPKCGYLGFESGDRCRNCGYEFSLSAVSSDPLDVALDLGPDESKPPLDLDRIIGAPEPSAADDLPLFAPPQHGGDARSSGRRTEMRTAVQDDAPLINAASRPRPPLVVRRATPEIPRARSRAIRSSTAVDTLFETPHAAVTDRVMDDAHAQHASGDPLAGAGSRILAALVDVALLSVLDAFILYLTLRLLGLATPQISALPLLPLIAFFVLLNGGYFVAFTAVGGQSIGKMAFGIKVISQEDSAVPVGRATLRTAAYFASALPLGAGFLPGVISADRLALHDRVAHTRVVRPSST
jgi:uncharacterized RDD family membrane protein YckC